MTGGKIQHSEALEFILAGKSTVTFLNTNTEKRFTYKIKKHPKNEIYFVSVLTSPDIYSFIGSVSIRNIYRHSVKSKIGEDAQSVKVFTYVLSSLVSNTLKPFIEIWHMGQCGRCGRKLTVPSSIESGYGPECVRLKNHKNV